MSAERLLTTAETLSTAAPQSPKDRLLGIKESFLQRLQLQQAEGEPARFSQLQTLKLLSMLLDPVHHAEALLHIDFGLPEFWRQRKGHEGEVSAMLEGLGITDGFCGPVAPMWRNIYEM